MGVRLALGARTWQIVRMLLADGLRPVAEGLVAGLAAADLVEMITRPAFVTPLPAIDPGVLMVVPLPFLLAAVVACLVPARRAARLAPNLVLKEP
jgi:ABC-type antimicrobial peptide transport system permease subunit